jgi:hypothetical protein
MTEALTLPARTDGNGGYWNHRVVVRELGMGSLKEDVYAIHEVYYSAAGDIVSWTEEPVAPLGETWLECLDAMAQMFRAATMPVVDVRSGQGCGDPQG